MRTCVATGTRLHLIEPLGFKLDESSIKRSGVNYIDKLEYKVYKNWEEFKENNEGTYYFFTRYGHKPHSSFDYSNKDNKNLYFVFGKETTGLPETFMREYYDRNLRIPMSDNIRCYNLSNSVAMVLLEALRQQGFPNMEKSHHYENDKLKDNYNRPERYERNLGEN